MYLPVGPGQDKGARAECTYLLVQDKTKEQVLNVLPVGPGQDEGASAECTYLLVQDKTKEQVLNVPTCWSRTRRRSPC